MEKGGKEGLPSVICTKKKKGGGGFPRREIGRSLRVELHKGGKSEKNG